MYHVSCIVSGNGVSCTHVSGISQVRDISIMYQVSDIMYHVSNHVSGISIMYHVSGAHYHVSCIMYHMPHHMDINVVTFRVDFHLSSRPRRQTLELVFLSILSLKNLDCPSGVSVLLLSIVVNRLLLACCS
jgi:hypothetical protein